jgi:hypothetical protein
MESKFNQFVIPKVTTLQAGLVTGRSAGIVAVGLMKDARRNAPRDNQYSVEPISSVDRAKYLSDLGTPVWDQVTFGTVQFINSKGEPDATPTMTFQAILLSVSFPRNIVKTTIQGRDGTVKEYIGEGDAQISFRGIICGANGHYPIDEVNALKALMSAPVAIPVMSTFLQNLDIHSVVFEDRNLEQEEGGYSYQTFSLNAISETPQELQMS